MSPEPRGDPARRRHVRRPDVHEGIATYAMNELQCII